MSVCRNGFAAAPDLLELGPVLLDELGDPSRHVDAGESGHALEFTTGNPVTASRVAGTRSEFVTLVVRAEPNR